MDLSPIIEAITSQEYPAHREEDLQEALDEVLRPLGFEREYITPKGRLDFFRVSDGVGIEVKIQGRKLEVARQLAGYAELDEVTSLILVTTKPTLASVPNELNDKPIATAKLYRSIL